MLEIIGLVFLSRRNGRVAAEKGYNKGPIIAMTVALWVGMEILGLVIGLSVSDEFGTIILCGILGAATGALMSYFITNNLRSKRIPDSAAASSAITSESSDDTTDNTAVPFKGQWICEKCGARNAVFDKEKCFKCGALKPQQDQAPSD
jgi:hypothetical protein